MPETSTPQLDEFVRLLTSVQRELYIYVISLVGDDAHANDILQNTNLVLWQKRDDYQQGTNFPAWATTVAYNQILAFRKRRSLDRHMFDGSLVSEFSTAVRGTLAQAGSRLALLDECIDKLPPAHRSLLMERYSPGGHVQSIAQSQGRSPAAISQLLFRIRCALIDCVEGKLLKECDG